MTEVELQLKRIQEKVQQLVKTNSILKKENQNLAMRLSKSKEQSEQLLQTIESLKQHVDILKLNSTELNEPDKKEIEKRINSYIKEIDRCIILLGE
jgi:tRNA nucleotidyltransferase/poly(A) polymerase